MDDYVGQPSAGILTSGFGFTKSIISPPPVEGSGKNFLNPLAPFGEKMHPIPVGPSSLWPENNTKSGFWLLIILE